MPTSYQTTELISSHHAEVERLCNELLDLGSRVAPGDPDAAVLRERARALCWRLREHLSTESEALISDAEGDRNRISALMNHCHDEGERLDRALEVAERDARGPLELVQAVCTIARSARAELDRVAHT